MANILYIFLHYVPLVIVLIPLVWGFLIVMTEVAEKLDVEDYEDTDWWEYV